MRSEEEVRKLRDELEEITDFIAEYGTDEDLEAIGFACDVSDALNWVLGEITTEHFLSDSYLDMGKLKRIIGKIEKRTGIKFEERLVREEDRNGAKEVGEAIREYVDFISKYADPDKIRVIDVGDDSFYKKLVNKEFTIIDVLEQDLGEMPPVVYAIIEVDGEKCLLRDEDMIYVDARTKESASSLGRKLMYMTRYRQLPLRVSIERLKTKATFYKWRIIRGKKHANKTEELGG
ncbi:MAG: hypothetical protein ACXQTN_00620 [Methanoculleaceae archaeon]